jgi:hypothetical protein
VLGLPAALEGSEVIDENLALRPAKSQFVCLMRFDLNITTVLEHQRKQVAGLHRAERGARTGPCCQENQIKKIKRTNVWSRGWSPA